MQPEDWDSRYAETDLMWSQTPNQFVEHLTVDLPPGRALDLAAGEGRNAIWLAERGWRVTAVDFSSVALERATRIAGERLGEAATRLTTVQADLLTYRPAQRSWELVIVVYLQVPAAQRTIVLQAAADAVAPGGRLLVVAHDTENAASGHGGPSDPAVLYSAADVVADLGESGVEILSAERVKRAVMTSEGPREALDCLVMAKRPTG